MLLPCPPAAARTTPWRSLPSGLQVRVLDARPSAELPVEAWLVRLEPGRHVLRTLARPPAAGGTAAPPRVASAVAQETQALAIVNASYFDPEGRPLGLLVADGQLLQPANRQGWAWAAVTDGRLVMKPAKADVPAGVEQAIQAGPILVQAGKPAELTSPRAARRAFVGRDASGRIVLGATNGALTLAELAALLASGEEAGGAGLTEALNLDGGSSAQLHVAGEDPPLKVAGVPVPVYLGVFAALEIAKPETAKPEIARPGIK